ncbi:MAG: glycogen-binding domain-containing protein [Phycisphaerales bacterium]
MTKTRTQSAVNRTTIHTEASDAKEVFVAGTFNDWNPKSHPLSPSSDGSSWRITLDLPPGRYEYKFIIDGLWCCEPGRDTPYHDCPGCVANPHGTMNRVLEVD